MHSKEKEIQRIKCMSGVSFPEARQIVETMVPTLPSNQSNPKVAKPMIIKINIRNIETQTIITWPQGENPKSCQSKWKRKKIPMNPIN